MATSNINTNINFESDSLNVIIAKQELIKFLEEQKQFEGKSTPKIDAYHKSRILELTNEILSN